MSNCYLLKFLSVNIMVVTCGSQAAGQVVSDDLQKLADNAVGRWVFSFDAF